MRDKFNELKARYCKKMLLKCVVMPIILFLLGILLWLSQGQNDGFIMCVLCSAVLLFIYFLACSNLDKNKTELEYDRLYKEILISENLNSVFDGECKFESEMGYTPQFVWEALGLDVSRRFCSHSYISGKCNNVSFTQAYIKDWEVIGLWRNGGVYIPSHSGMVYALNKKIAGLPNATMAIGDLSFMVRGEKASFCNQELDKMSKVYTENIQEFKNFVTENFQKKILELSKSFGRKMLISFYNEQIYVYIKDKDSVLKANRSSNPDNADKAKVADELRTVEKLIDALIM